MSASASCLPDFLNPSANPGRPRLASSFNVLTSRLRQCK